GERDGPVLSVRDVSISFGGIHALDKVSFDVQRGTVFGLIGPNGAGKTTLVNIITGALRPDAGVVTFGGGEVTGLRPHARARMGLSRTFQAPRLLPSLSLERNASIGQWYARSTTGRRPIKPALLLEMMGLSDLTGRKVSSLNLAEQRRVEIARALATNPELVLLDEPTAGMNHVEAFELIKLVVSACKRWGITVLLIEHNMNIVMGFSDEITVVSFGKQIAAGTPDQIKTDQTVIDAYLGSHA
ncbi:ABC transporter ATP-binding protein, partial [Aeromicrobium sp.]|uniref:ABC transporter ATP-binding protein n=1 Tax=Aeromicrobium sp. TaxID=1871063 RepID=UPI003C5D8A06